MVRAVAVLVLIAGLVAVGWWAWRADGERGARPALTFFVIGDNHGPRPVYRELLEQAKQAGAAFVVNVADLTEHGSEDELQDVRALEAAVGLPVEHVIGSHDIKSDLTRATWERVVGPAYRSFDRGGSHFVLLDNADRKVGFPDAELRWLERDLGDHRRPPTFLFYHRPFGLPLEGLFGDDETPASRATNERFRGILRRSRPTMLFTGHVHAYLPYTLEGVSAYGTGGGGDPAQQLLGGASSSFFHGLLITVRGGQPGVRVLRAVRGTQ